MPAMRARLIILMPVLCLTFSLYTQIALAAPVYIDGFSGFPAYPYNSGGYMQGGAFVGCGPTTGAMILGYFEHHFGATGLLENPVAGTNEGLETAWELHSQNYMKTGANGFGSPAYIKPGMEDYAEDRGYEIKVMVHYEIGIDPGDVNTAWYDGYGEGWIDDVDWWIDVGVADKYEIDDDKFCDYVEAKLAAGIGVWLSVDPGDPPGSDNPLGSADHWVPCVGVDKDAGTYYFYNTWDSSIHSVEIASAGALAGSSTFAIGFLRTVTYIGPIQQPPTAASIESSDVDGNKKDQFDPSDTLYVYGSNYDPDQEYDIYVVADSTWTDGMSIPARITSTATTVTSDASGNIPAGTQVWSSPLTPGKYDIVVDVNGNGVYDEGVDALDDSDIKVTAGFFVIPEYAFGTILGLVACFTAFGVFMRLKRIK